MTEALWRHALGFLDRHGARAGQHWEELYEFSDKTGILERHKQLLARPGHSAEVRHPRTGTGGPRLYLASELVQPRFGAHLRGHARASSNSVNCDHPPIDYPSYIVKLQL